MSTLPKPELLTELRNLAKTASLEQGLRVAMAYLYRDYNGIHGMLLLLDTQTSNGAKHNVSSGL